MNYPDNFDIPTFPAGRRIAAARVVAIGTAIVFLLICFACAILIWMTRSQHTHPFLISVNDNSGQWQIVGHDHGRKTMSAVRTLQESVIARFVQNWFMISGQMAENELLWQGCDRNIDCVARADNAQYGDRACALFCISGDDIFSKFSTGVVPNYMARARAAEQWAVINDTIRMSPVGTVRDVGGTWRIQLTVQSNMSAPISILAYAKVARNQKLYPQTLGYHVVDFNAYKIN